MGQLGCRRILEQIPKCGTYENTATCNFSEWHGIAPTTALHQSSSAFPETPISLYQGIYGCALCVLAPEASRPGGPPDRVPHPVSYPAWPHTKEWNGSLAEEHVRRENAILTQTRRVCVCGKRENHPVPQGGGGGGFSFLPGPHAQLENLKTAGVGGGEAEGYPVPQGGGWGEYT